jgi:DNA ligase (NAD+)
MPSQRKPSDPAARVSELIEEIRRHDRLYFEEAAPVIGDAEYDALVRELTELERAHPELLRPDSPTQRVGGAPVASLTAAEHRRPMLSLQNTYDRAEVDEWVTSIGSFLGVQGSQLVFACEPKLDGLALEVIYERGRLVRAITRGDGRVGDDVTHTVRTIRSLPQTLRAPPPALLEVRGEAIMTRETF